MLDGDVGAPTQLNPLEKLFLLGAVTRCPMSHTGMMSHQAHLLGLVNLFI